MKKFCVLSVILLLFSFAELHAKTCSTVDSEFKRKVKTLKTRWAREDESLETRLSRVEKKITAIDKESAKEIEALMKKNDISKKRDLKVEKTRYDRSVAAVEKVRIAYKKKASKDFERKKKGLEKLRNEKEKLKKENQALEKIKLQMENQYAKAEKKALFEVEKIRMQEEDKERKFKRDTAEAYQKDFNKINKQLQEWDKREAQEKKKLSIADKEIETFAAGQMEKVEKLRIKLDKKREDLKKRKLKAEELDKETMKLDMTLAQESDKLNKELNNYRKKKLVEKKQAKKAFNAFLKKKKDFKKRYDAMVKNAQRKRDLHLKQKKDAQKREEAKWERERKLREERYTRNLDFKYGTKAKALKKKTVTLDNRIAKSENGLERFKVKQKQMVGKKENGWRKKESRAEDWQRTALEEIAVKYENRIMQRKKRTANERKKLMTQRDKYLAQQKTNRKKRQAKLGTMKKQYQKQKSRCK